MHGDLLDPAAFGVRLGVNLRAAAEIEARRAGVPLSVWVRLLVQERLREVVIPNAKAEEHKSETSVEFEAAYAAEMGKLK
ncbi:MAG: hypothetical protein ACRD4R_02755 [Candidatus Acidiferrales bacterium]